MDKDLQVVLNSGDITNINLNGTASSNKVLTKGELDSEYQDIAGNTAIDKAKLTPTATSPTYTEGQYYYNSTTGTFNFQGSFSGIEVQPGHGEHVHVINNTGATIEAGMAVRPAGVSAGKVQITKALADSFSNARVMGIAIQDILDGQESAVAFSGILTGLNTNGLTTGVPQYLSDTVAGTYTHVAPSIRTVVGGVFVADATAGVLRVDLTANQNIPTVFGGLQGFTSGNDVFALTTTAQDIDNYASKTEVVVSVDALTGQVTLPNTGQYRVNFSGSITFASSTSTRSITLELYDVTNAEIHYSFVKNIPRNATEDGFSFSYPIDEIAANVHKMRIKSSTAISVTFTDVSFDVESVSIIT